MATTKTLTPTNQAITLAAFTEKPDNRTNVTNDDKLADAVNALNSKMTTWSTVSGVEEAVEFQLPTDAVEVIVLCLFSSGQQLVFYLPLVGIGGIREDKGFYYTPSTNGSGAVTVSWNKRLNVFHPYFAGAQTTYSGITVFIR